MELNITVIKGDGIGPEIGNQAIKVIEKISKKFSHKINVTEALLGGIAIDTCGTPLPDETINICKSSDAVLLGAVGGSKWDNLESSKRPEKGLLNLRKELGLYANIRPAILFEELKSASPLKEDLIKNGVDICIVRELTGGIYFGEKKLEENKAYDIEQYSRNEIYRICKKAFEIARKRKGKLTSIDKANVLCTSRLWRSIVEDMAKEYNDVSVEHMYVDNAAMQLINQPSNFDVVVTNNIFGDILSDEASMVVGSIGILPSASLREDNFGLYEPIHGSAPDIANKDIANPIGMILSLALMFRESFSLEDEANVIQSAVSKVLRDGFRTADIMEDGKKLIGTSEMGKLICEAL